MGFLCLKPNWAASSNVATVTFFEGNLHFPVIFERKRAQWQGNSKSCFSSRCHDFGTKFFICREKIHTWVWGHVVWLTHAHSKKSIKQYIFISYAKQHLICDLATSQRPTARTANIQQHINSTPRVHVLSDVVSPTPTPSYLPPLHS